jgi:hypothetical protein
LCCFWEGQCAHGGGEERFFDVDFFVSFIYIGAPGYKEAEETARLEEFCVNAIEEGVDSV